jgi:hypothetical protein
MLSHELGTLLQPTHVTRLRCDSYSATADEVAGNRFLLDQTGDIPDSIERQLEHSASALGTEPMGQFFHLRFVAREHLPAIPPAGSPPNRVLLEYRGIDTPAGQRSRGRQAGVSATNDGNVGTGGQIRGFRWLCRGDSISPEAVVDGSQRARTRRSAT